MRLGLLMNSGSLFGAGLIWLGGVVELFLVGLVTAEAVGNLGLLIMDRRSDGGQPCRMNPGMLDDIVAECIMFIIARGIGRLGRFKAHVVPAEVFEAVADLAEALRTHRGPSGTLACKEA